MSLGPRSWVWPEDADLEDNVEITQEVMKHFRGGRQKGPKTDPGGELREPEKEANKRGGENLGKERSQNRKGEFAESKAVGSIRCCQEIGKIRTELWHRVW